MPKLTEFIIRKDYLANYGDEDRTQTQLTPMRVSNYDAIKHQLSVCINQNNPDQLKLLLESEFITPEVKSYEKITFDSFPKSQWDTVNIFGDTHIIINPGYGKGQRDTHIYAEHYVYTVLEYLLKKNKTDYIAMINSASEECKKQLMNFVNVDMSDANLSHIDTSYADFTGCNLKNTKGISQKTLDSSISYNDALLPKGLIPFWTESKKNQVLKGIARLQEYGERLLKSTDSEGKEKGKITVALSATLKENIASTNNYNGAFQTEFLRLLHQHDEVLNHKRYHGFKMIITNIAFCILGLGVGYLIAGIANHKITGHFLFFDQTHTEQKVEEINSALTLN